MTNGERPLQCAACAIAGSWILLHKYIYLSSQPNVVSILEIFSYLIPSKDTLVASISVVIMLSSTSQGKVLKRADPSTIQNKFMVGYQGWFTCGGDGPPVGPGHHGWLHWFNYPIPDGGRPNTDLWPDVSEYSPSELFPAPGLKLANGEQTFLFSSRHPKTVQRHFHWMAEHGVDGAFLQRFAGQTDLEGGNEGIRNMRDEIGDRVREAAEAEGRTFAIMYVVFSQCFHE